MLLLGCERRSLNRLILQRHGKLHLVFFVAKVASWARGVTRCATCVCMCCPSSCPLICVICCCAFVHLFICVLRHAGCCPVLWFCCCLLNLFCTQMRLFHESTVLLPNKRHNETVPGCIFFILSFYFTPHPLVTGLTLPLLCQCCL